MAITIEIVAKNGSTAKETLESYNSQWRYEVSNGHEQMIITIVQIRYEGGGSQFFLIYDDPIERVPNAVKHETFPKPIIVPFIPNNAFEILGVIFNLSETSATDGDSL